MSDASTQQAPNPSLSKFTIVKSSNVAINQAPLETHPNKDFLKTLISKPIEASSCSDNTNFIHLNEEIWAANHFLLMLQIAFNSHKAISISPDHIWLLICQGFADHIKISKELFKDKIILDSATSTIQIRRDDFVKGGNNPWEELLPEFSGQICQYIDKDLYDNTVLKFSTTTSKESTAFEIAFLDAMFAYFTYEFATLCGIPSVKILGDADDYLKIHQALDKLKTYELDWWINKLQSHLEKIIRSCKGENIPDFWQSIYKEDNQSGGPYITGWIVDFFPYLKHTLSEEEGVIDYGTISEKQVIKVLKVTDYKNLEIKLMDVVIQNPKLMGDHDFTIKLDKLPRGLSQVPFKWQYLNQSYDMNFVSGFMGIREDQDTNTLETDIHWAVCEG